LAFGTSGAAGRNYERTQDNKRFLQLAQVVVMPLGQVFLYGRLPQRPNVAGACHSAAIKRSLMFTEVKQPRRSHQ
jgi:hypothetical protein